MTYVLHYAPDNASLVVRLALDQIGVTYRCALVDRSRNAQRSDAYTALNPNGLIPTLEADQGVIFETGAILLWLADHHGGLGPAPGDIERGDFLKWLFFVSNTVHPTLRQLFYPEQFIGPDPAHQAILRDRAQHALMAHHTKLNTLATQGRTWCANPTPSALDFYIAATLRWPAIYPTDQNHSWHSIANYPALHDMCLRLEALPLTQGLIKAEGMNATPFTAPEISNPPEGSAT
jgi:glutathione S-transferase